MRLKKALSLCAALCVLLAGCASSEPAAGTEPSSSVAEISSSAEPSSSQPEEASSETAEPESVPEPSSSATEPQEEPEAAPSEGQPSSASEAPQEQEIREKEEAEDVSGTQGGTDAQGSGQDEEQQSGGGNQEEEQNQGSGSGEYVGDKYATGYFDEYLGWCNGWNCGIGSEDNVFGDFRGQDEPGFSCDGKDAAERAGAEWDPYYGGWVYTQAAGGTKVIFPSGSSSAGI